MVKLVTVPFQFVVHVEGNHHTHVHVNQLAGQVQVAFQVGSIDDIDHDVRLFFFQVFAYIELFRRVGRKGIGPRQVYDLESVAVLMECPGFGIDCHATVVADMLVCAGCEIE